MFEAMLPIAHLAFKALHRAGDEGPPHCGHCNLPALAAGARVMMKFIHLVSQSVSLFHGPAPRSLHRLTVRFANAGFYPNLNHGQDTRANRTRHTTPASPDPRLSFLVSVVSCSYFRHCSS